MSRAQWLETLDKRYKIAWERSAKPRSVWKWFLPSESFFKKKRGGFDVGGGNFFNWERRFPPRGGRFVVIETWYIVYNPTEKEHYLYVRQERPTDLLESRFPKYPSEKFYKTFGERASSMSEKEATAKMITVAMEKAPGESFPFMKFLLEDLVRNQVKRLISGTVGGSPGLAVRELAGWALYPGPEWKKEVKSRRRHA